MKHSPSLIILLTLLCLCWDTARAREHEWTNTRGQTIKAEFIFMKGDNVTISMKGKTYGLKLSSLSPESQALARKLSATNSNDKLTPEECVWGSGHPLRKARPNRLRNLFAVGR